ncbi:MAG: transcription factor [Thermoprotei archaeon]|nr:MAG: transcription factor [Thermoprotei archaeon]
MDRGVENVLRMIEMMFGETARRVFEVLLASPREVTDEEVAQKLGLRVNDVRRALYEMSRFNFVTYRRTRQGEGIWYVYYWRVDVESLKRLLLMRKKLVLQKLRQRLEFEKNNVFFVCPNDGSRYTFDEAFENGFKCPRCGADLVEESNEEVVKVLEAIVRKFEEELLEDEKAISS